MVTCILSALRFGWAVLSRSVLLLVLPAGSALASTVNLAPGLELTLPSPLVMNVLESQGQYPIILGEIDGEPGYFIAAVRVNSWERNNILWKKLETELRNRSEMGDLITGTRGNFTTLAGDNTWYRVYEFRQKDQSHRQAYFLLRNEQAIYWVTLTVVEGVSIDLAIPIAKTLIRRARLVE